MSVFDYVEGSIPDLLSGFVQLGHSVLVAQFVEHQRVLQHALDMRRVVRHGPRIRTAPP
jgi:hypothetical protein